METDNRHIVQKVTVNLCRFVLGATFIFSGFVKAVDPLGFFYKIQDYLEAFGIGEWLHPILILLSGIGLSSIEFCVGIFLFFGIRRGMSSFTALLMMAFMTPLTFYLAQFNPVPDCGCFCDAWVMTNWQTYGKNVVLLSAAIFDFRPYKIGVNIPQAMEIPEGAKPSVFEARFVLEKDGKQKEFTTENYPYEDSTWVFVEVRSVLVEQGYEPPVKDFYIADLNTDESLTDRILSDSNYVFLLVMHRVEEADDGNIDLINEIYDYSVEHGYAFYALTSSPRDAIELWSDRTGGEYPFGIMDDITLKTIIRSNPGLLLLKGGTILNKWSDNRLPDEYVLTDSLDKLPLGRQKPVSDGRTMGYVLLWFILPLLAVIALDVLVVKRRARRKAREQLSFEKEENIH